MIKKEIIKINYIQIFLIGDTEKFETTKNTFFFIYKDFVTSSCYISSNFISLIN